MKEFIDSLHGVQENIWDLKRGLIMLAIILGLTGTALFFNDFQGTSRLNIVLTIISFIAVAFFNVHIVPYIAYKEAWKWNFLLLMLPVTCLGIFAIGYVFYYFPLSLLTAGGLGTFIRLLSYKSTVPLSRK